MIIAILSGLAFVVGYVRRRRQKTAYVLAQLKRHRRTPAIDNPAYLSSDEQVRPISIAQGLALTNPNYSSVGHTFRTLAFQDAPTYAVLEGACVSGCSSGPDCATGVYNKIVRQSQVFLVPTEGGAEAVYTQVCVTAVEAHTPARKTTGTVNTLSSLQQQQQQQGCYTVERPQSLYSIPHEGGGEAVYSEAYGMAPLPPPPLVYDILSEEGFTGVSAETSKGGGYLDVEGSVLKQPMCDAATAGALLAEVPQYDLAAPQQHAPKFARHGSPEVAEGDPGCAETTM